MPSQNNLKVEFTFFYTKNLLLLPVNMGKSVFSFVFLLNRITELWCECNKPKRKCRVVNTISRFSFLAQIWFATIRDESEHKCLIFDINRGKLCKMIKLHNEGIWMDDQCKQSEIWFKQQITLLLIIYLKFYPHFVKTKLLWKVSRNILSILKSKLTKLLNKHPVLVD